MPTKVVRKGTCIHILDTETGGGATYSTRTGKMWGATKYFDELSAALVMTLDAPDPLAFLMYYPAPKELVEKRMKDLKLPMKVETTDMRPRFERL